MTETQKFVCDQKTYCESFTKKICQDLLITSGAKLFFALMFTDFFLCTPSTLALYSPSAFSIRTQIHKGPSLH